MSVPESHRRLLAKLEGQGLHLHKDYVFEVWRTVGLVERTHGAPLRVCADADRLPRRQGCPITNVLLSLGCSLIIRVALRWRGYGASQTTSIV